MFNITPATKHELPSPPPDTISSISWHPSSRCICATSWASEARIWDFSTQIGQPVTQIKHDMPIFSSAFLNQQYVITVGADKIVKMTDLSTKTPMTIGQHELPIRRVCAEQSQNVILTGSWDKNVCIWNPSTPSTPTAKIPLPDRVYALDYRNPYFLVGTADRHARMFDVRNMSKPVKDFDYKESPITCCKMNTRADGFVVGSNEGKVHVFNFPNSKIKKKEWTFRTQRVVDQKQTLIHTVNDMSYHPNGVLTTGGSDGTYTIWNVDLEVRCGYSQHDVKYPLPVTSLNFSPDGRFLAFAIGYDWEFGPPNATAAQLAPHVYLHELKDFDVAKCK
ncbi:putative polyA+ RNA export [Monocercomonoides exilis]|uniref:putative polyA+ RNA export n=1 Tax=Monocercomonoides exilis TaxID=2049356 RepID=UPI00355984B2|nr:putative polyA+ RNA export [Monocercomonoides exilis]|eukprot:MONOS_8776.1-p1 / transcript=MONOS_8776.1 / gene=MONOS_8776 / organism=Monocercomonoides_exilis_PA203 / gene_product=polyA / transcript_product=polyA / location=Mono_scaffold00340:49885-51259(-) / protein_length=334 / sequence_SO=supercontig / SO=protein_coding / is_pseudo=false